LATKVAEITCPACGARYRSKLRRGTPTKPCPNCSKRKKP